MKSFKEYLIASRTRFLVAVVLATAAAIGFYTRDYNATTALVRFVGFQIGNVAIWYLLAGWNAWMDAVKMKARIRWGTTMLRTIQLAKEADGYHAGNPNLISAYHDAVTTCEREGIKAGYLNVGRL